MQVKEDLIYGYHNILTHVILHQYNIFIISQK